MMLTAERTVSAASIRVFGPAIVRQVDAAAHRVLVQVLDDGDQQGRWARIASVAACDVRVGDEVLVTGDDDALYLIGSLTPAQPRLGLARGRHAVVDDAGVLRVVAADGEVLLELDSQRDALRVVAPRGTLELEAPIGDLALRSSGAVRIDAGELHLCAQHLARVAVGDGRSHEHTALTLNRGRAGLHGGEVAVNAARGEFHIVETRYVGMRFAGALDSARLVVHRIETVAQTVIAKARNVYQNVAELLQQRAGRLRTLVDGTLHQRSRRAMLQSDEDFKVKADRIHLG